MIFVLSSYERLMLYGSNSDGKSFFKKLSGQGFLGSYAVHIYVLKIVQSALNDYIQNT